MKAVRIMSDALLLLSGKACHDALLCLQPAAYFSPMGAIESGEAMIIRGRTSAARHLRRRTASAAECSAISMKYFRRRGDSGVIGLIL